MVDPTSEYMAGIESALSDVLARVDALENVVSRMNGAAMQSDPSRLPVVVYGNTPVTLGVPANGDN